MNFLNDPQREVLIRQALRARTLPEVHAAQTALRQWHVRYPDDWGILDAGEQLSLMEDALLEDDSPPGKSPSWTEWQQLEYEVIGARSLPEIRQARHALRQWMEQHPNEVKPDLLEMLFLLLDVVEEEQTGEGRSQSQREREPAGQVA